MTQSWDAFISYARAESASEAAALQVGIERFAKSWNRLRACRVFRDDASMSANAGLWSAIEGALTDSQYLILILSRAAAKSSYVDNEVQWWLQHKSSETVLLVHDDGALAWDRASNRFSRDTDCVPPALVGAYREEPRWLDFSWFDHEDSLGTSDPRFTGIVADLASPIRGIERDELIGENVAQHRKARRLARGGATALAVLLGLSLLASGIATMQRYSIARQARTLQARQLAATAEKYLETDLRLSQLLALEAHKTEASPSTYAALLKASVSSPYLRGFHEFSDDVKTISASGDGRLVVAALSNGDVVAVDTQNLAHETRLFSMEAPGDALSVSRDGRVVLATDRREAWMWTATSGPVRLSLPPDPADEEIKSVSVSPDGHTGMISWGWGYTTPRSLSVLAIDELAADRHSASAITSIPDRWEASRVVFRTDEQVLLLDDGYGSWRIVRLPDLRTLSNAGVGLGTHNWLGVPAPGGRFVTATYTDPGANIFYVWNTTDPDPEWGPGASLVAHAPVAAASALAVSPNGKWVAAAGSSGLYLTQTESTAAGPGSTDGFPVTFALTGTGQVHGEALAFLGGSARLATASGSQLAVWDTASLGRITQSAESEVPAGSNAGRGPTITLSPRGASVACVNDFGDHLMVRPVPGRKGISFDQKEYLDDFSGLGPPLWLDEDVILLPASYGFEEPRKLRENLMIWGLGWEDQTIVDARVAPDAARFWVVGSNGVVERRNWTSGVTEVHWDGPECVSASLSAKCDKVALVVENDTGSAGKVVVFDTKTGERIATASREGAVPTDASFDGRRLVVDFGGDEGAAIWDELGRGPMTPVPVQVVGWHFPPLTAAAPLLCFSSRQGTILYDASSREVIGTIPVPGGLESTKYDCEMTPDGSKLVTVYESAGLITVTDLEPDALARVAKEATGSELTDGERALYVAVN